MERYLAVFPWDYIYSFKSDFLFQSPAAVTSDWAGWKIDGKLWQRSAEDNSDGKIKSYVLQRKGLTQNSKSCFPKNLNNFKSISYQFCTLRNWPAVMTQPEQCRWDWNQRRVNLEGSRMLFLHNRLTSNEWMTLIIHWSAKPSEIKRSTPGITFRIPSGGEKPKRNMRLSGNLHLCPSPGPGPAIAER